MMLHMALYCLGRFTVMLYLTYSDAISDMALYCLGRFEFFDRIEMNTSEVHRSAAACCIAAV